MTDLPAAAFAAWSSLADIAFPVELGTAWLRAEWGRLTPRSYLECYPSVDRAQAAASWMLLDGNEERRGCSCFDLLLDSHVDEGLRDAGPEGALLAPRCAELRQRWSELGPLRTATVTTTAAYWPGIVWQRTVGGADQREILRGLTAGVRGQAEQSGAAVLAVVNVPEAPPFDALTEVLQSSGFLQVACAPDSVLVVPSSGIDEYVRRLRPSFRQAVRKEMRIFSATVDRVALYGAERLLEADLARLLDLRYGKYGHATNPDALSDRMRRVASIPGLRVLVVEQAGRATGFVALVLDARKKRLIPRLSGCEPNDSFIYFNTIFYEPLRLAAEWGYEEIGLGSTAYRAKLLRGARLRSRSAFLCPVGTAGEQQRGQLEETCAFRNTVETARLRALQELSDV